jgi:hypothetical protein
VRYAEARWKLYQRDEVYRIYVTDGIRALVNSNSKRYIDFFEPEMKEDDRTPEEIIENVKKALMGDKL